MRRALLALAVVLELAACAGPVLRQSVCVQPRPGVQVCQFAYDGDKEGE